MRVLFCVLAALALPSALSAQDLRRCQTPDTLSTTQLRECVKALAARSYADSLDAATHRARVDSLTETTQQILATLLDLQRKLPPEGQTVAEYVANVAPHRDSTMAMVIPGDLILRGRLCIPDACLEDAGEQIQIRSAKAAAILFQANRDGTWEQSPCSGMSVVGMSPDLGLRLVQNQRWTPEGKHVDFICPTHPTGAVGFDSQAEWSFNGQKPGHPHLQTQRLVIRTDEDARIVYFATWAEGWKVQFRSSADGCKWCENLRWSVPYQ